METRANHVWVGVVTLALLALMAAVVLWIARFNDGRQDDYDIFFKQSVDGLAKGSQVTFSGVPAGQIDKIELWPRDPSFVRVRIKVDDKVPILQGTTATILGSFTGVSTIQLEGAVKGALPLSEPGPEGVPVIPTKRGGLGALLNNAPLLLERLATLSERLTQVLSDRNQKSVANILSNTDRMTANLAAASPQVERTMAELQVTLRQASAALAAFEQAANSASGLLANEGQPLARQVRETLAAAKQAADALKATATDARPAARELSDKTLPAAAAAIQDLRDTSRALREITQKIDDQGAGALLGKSKLPDYQP